MAMRVTRFMFGLSDALAWLLCFLALIAAVLNLPLAPLAAAMDHETVSWLATTLRSLALLVFASGAYGLTRRRPLALIPVLLPASFMAAHSDHVVMFTLGVSAWVVFGLPFLLAFLEVRSNRRRQFERTSLKVSSHP